MPSAGLRIILGEVLAFDGQMVPVTDGGRGEAGTGSLGKSSGRIAFLIEGYTPRRRGDSARRVQWPEQGEAEVRTPRPRKDGGVYSIRQGSQVTTTSANVASYRRPSAGKPPTTATREAANSAPAGCSSTLPHEAGRWHVSGRSGRLQATDRPACA